MGSRIRASGPTSAATEVMYRCRRLSPQCATSAASWPATSLSPPTSRRRMERARTEAIIASQTDIAMAGHDTDTVMTRIVARAVALTGASGASVEIAEGDEMVSALATGASSRPPGCASPGRAASRASASPTIKSSIARTASTTFASIARRAGEVGARSMVVVPLHQQTASAHGAEGRLTASHGFTESDVETLELLANLMGAAIAHAEDYARVAEANSRLRDLDRLKDEFVATVSTSCARRSRASSPTPRCSYRRGRREVDGPAGEDDLWSRAQPAVSSG